MHNLFCSTGCIIGRDNNYDYKQIFSLAPQIEAEAFELMMLRAYYGHFKDIADDINRSGLRFPVIHSDKDIGILLSRGTAEDTARAYELFDSNCSLGRDIGASLIVLHLWGGECSDTRFEYNSVCFGRLLETAALYNITTVVENIPCMVSDPLSHWDSLEKTYPDIRFIFDTRFGAFHSQTDDFLGSDRIERKKVLHMHISDFEGPPHDFSSLRPILHPHEGIIDFESFFTGIKNRYDGSITLESPVLSARGVDVGKLNATLEFIGASLDSALIDDRSHADTLHTGASYAAIKNNSANV